MKKISPSKIKEAIMEAAKIKKRKQELYENVKQINNELKTLTEGNEILNEVGFVGGYGFAVDGDLSQKTKTGFVNDFQGENISFIARLEDEMSSKEEINEDTIDEIKKLRDENEALKKQIEESVKAEAETSEDSEQKSNQ